ncbi:hypothetical protein D1164_11660 [Mariniphaga sediminis]|uniref:Uncharacterized protein n=1 Tax=Mariniphaga sediminis TaxID=1628158 RepID=A0A399D053_9BACT|nr:hypothetical protein D1164_11660 [Mariniphaga sediminis]
MDIRHENNSVAYTLSGTKEEPCLICQFKFPPNKLPDSFISGDDMFIFSDRIILPPKKNDRPANRYRLIPRAPPCS